MKKTASPALVCERPRPRWHIAKRGVLPFGRSALYHVLGLIAALTVGGLLILALGHNPFAVYASMLKGALGTKTGARETVKMAVPLLITGIGIALAFRMRFWNIGAEGQILIGAIAATGVLVYAPGLPRVLSLILMAATACLAGGLYGAVPAFFKTRWGTNETLFTLMLNYVSLQLLRYLMYQPAWQDPGTKFPKIFAFSDQQILPKVLGVHIGWIFALVLTALAWIYLAKTKHGYEISVVGDSANTARYAGMPVSWIQVRTIFISAALCGLAGYFQAAGADGTLHESTAGGVGFTAITVAWLAKLNPPLMVPVAIFIALLRKGSMTIQSAYQIPASAADLLIGLILFFMLGVEFFCSFRILKSRKEA